MSDPGAPPWGNPFARAHAPPGAIEWSVRMPEGGVARWPARLGSILPGLAVVETPRVPLYDTDGSPDVAAGDAAALLPRLLAGEGLPADAPRIVVARRIAAEGAAWDALRSLAAEGRIGLTIIAAWERSVLDRAAAPDAEACLRQGLSPARLKRLRQKRRALEKTGALELAVDPSPDAVMKGYAAFLALEAAGWKGRAGTALAQDAAGERHARGLLSALAADGDAFAPVLSLDGRPVAAALLLRAGGDVVFWKTAFDETLAKHSPGVVFDMLLTEWLFDQPWFERMDTGHDDSVDPASLIWGERRRMADVVIDLAPGSLRGRLAAAALGLRQRLRLWRLRRAQAAK